MLLPFALRRLVAVTSAAAGFVSWLSISLCQVTSLLVFSPGVSEYLRLRILRNGVSNLATLNAARRSSREVEERSIVCYARGQLIARVAVKRHGNEQVAVGLAQVVDSDDAQRTVDAAHTRKLFECNALSGLEAKVANRLAHRVLLFAQLKVDVEAIDSAYGQGQFLRKGELVDVTLLEVEARRCDVVNLVACSVLQREAESGVGIVVVDANVTLNLSLRLVDNGLVDVESSKEGKVVKHLDVVKEQEALVAVLIDKSNVNVLARKLCQTNGVVLPIAFE